LSLSTVVTGICCPSTETAASPVLLSMLTCSPGMSRCTGFVSLPPCCDLWTTTPVAGFVPDADFSPEMLPPAMATTAASVTRRPRRRTTRRYGPRSSLSRNVAMMSENGRKNPWRKVPFGASCGGGRPEPRSAARCAANAFLSRSMSDPALIVALVFAR